MLAVAIVRRLLFVWEAIIFNRLVEAMMAAVVAGNHTFLHHGKKQRHCMCSGTRQLGRVDYYLDCLMTPFSPLVRFCGRLLKTARELKVRTGTLDIAELKCRESVMRYVLMVARSR